MFLEINVSRWKTRTCLRCIGWRKSLVNRNMICRTLRGSVNNEKLRVEFSLRESLLERDRAMYERREKSRLVCLAENKKKSLLSPIETFDSDKSNL